MNTSAWQAAQRLLCIRLDQIGDVLMTTPALRALKAGHAARHITLLSSPAGAQVGPYIPEVDDTISYAAPWIQPESAPGPAPGTSDAACLDFALHHKLVAGKFDAAVIFTSYSQNPLPAALMCRLAGIPLRLAHCREHPHELLSDWLPDPEPRTLVRHEVVRQLALVAAVGCRSARQRLSLRVTLADLAWARGLLAAHDMDLRQPWIVLHPGAPAAARRYPDGHWRQVARALMRRIGCPLIFTGTAEEAPLIDGIREGLKPAAISLAGQLDLGKQAALISLAPLLIANDSGPSHLAAALGTPVVDLYALTHPQHTPWQVPSRVLFHAVPCAFCYERVCRHGHQDCLQGVAPDRVVRAALALLGAVANGGKGRRAEAAWHFPTVQTALPDEVCS